MSNDPAEVEARCGRWFATVETHATIGSTNDRAKQLAVSETTKPALILAERQTAGRGRGSNQWWAPDVALTFSLLLDASTHAVRREALGLLSIATAVAVIEAVESVSGVVAQLKWPNDVLIRGRKLAGVLIESPRPLDVVVGVGINVSGAFDSAPDEVRRRAVALEDFAEASPDRLELLESFLARFFALIDLTNDRPPAFIEMARSACVLTGGEVSVRDGDRSISGRCEGVADDGALKVQTTAGIECVYAGTVERIG